MGLMAVVPLGPISATMAEAHIQGAGGIIAQAAVEVSARGNEVIERLEEELEKVMEKIEEEMDDFDFDEDFEGEEIDSELLAQVEDLTERIEEVDDAVYAGICAGDDAIMGLDVSEDDYSVLEAYAAFESAFYSAIGAACPVRTGFLRASCMCFFAGESILCVALAPYAQYVEYGTSRMHAQPYFEQAIEQGVEAMKPYLAKLLDKMHMNAQMDGRAGASSVVSTASGGSPDLSGSIGGVLGIVMGIFVSSIINVLLDEVEALFMDIDYEVSVV